MTAIESDDRAAIQRRTLRVLSVGQVIGAAALAASVTVGAFVVQDILGDETPFGGLASATLTAGSAVMAQVLARLMARRGRRIGLQVGYGLATVGGLLAALGADAELLPVFLAGLLIFGTGQSANLLSRYAAMDLATVEDRGRAMSRIVFASTFGAVFGPLLVRPAEHVGEAWFGLGRYTGPWLFSALIFALAAVYTAGALRPDPLLLASGGRGAAAAPVPRVGEALRVIGADPRARVAVLAMMVSQGSMAAVMTMTPVHMRLHGHEATSQYVVSLHIAGMYALSPLVGRFSDRRGRFAAIQVGAVVLVAANVTAALAGDGQLLLFPALWMLGLGWNFGLIGGSSLLTESVPAESRVAVQGSADLLMSVCGGLAGFSSGFIRRLAGFHMLANLATGAGLVLFLLAMLAAERNRAEPVTVPTM